MIVKVGCCGFARGMERYFKEFKLVEVQQTFYKIPKLDTIEKWKRRAPEDFEFAVKAFQGVSHPAKSPTWRKSGIELKGDEKYGYLQSSEEVFESWRKTLEVCKILDTKVCIIQLPKTFNEEMKENAENFFSKIERDGLNIAIELRGWKDESIRELCEKFDLIDCRDPFSSMPTFLSSKGIAYFRLHGSPPGKKMYSYKYTNDDLMELKRKIESIDAKEVYVLFNNVYMFEDAKRFMKLLEV
ncbi:MAG: DUF72 domain-containing protein [Thermoplasmata archaeon]|nr:DUF72 domain-containing protein [Thermoplasmata archaeon]